MNAILFDFGGTIDTDGVHWSEKFWEFYQQFGIDVQKRSYEDAFVQSEVIILQWTDLPKATFYRTLHKQLSLQFAHLKLEVESPQVKQLAEACYADVKRTIDRAKKVLVELCAQYRLGLVSNFYGNLDVVCREFGLDNVFAAVVDSAVVGVRKPDPAIFTLALKKLDARAPDSFAVGDSYERDIVPAKQLGFTTIWLKGKSWTSPPPSTEAADYTVSRLEDVRGILL